MRTVFARCCDPSLALVAAILVILVLLSWPYSQPHIVSVQPAWSGEACGDGLWRWLVGEA